jgi:hypothetical protein
VTEDEAASAAGVEQGSRNLLMRVIAASVLAPSAIAIAYAGGWLWLGLVTLAAIGLYVEWLTIVGARTPRVMAAGIVTLFGAAVCLEIGRIGATYVIIALGVIIARVTSSSRLGRAWRLLCVRGADRLGRGAARPGLRIHRADAHPAGCLGDRYRRLFCRPGPWWTETLAEGQSQEDLGRRHRRLCR